MQKIESRKQISQLINEENENLRIIVKFCIIEV